MGLEVHIQLKAHLKLFSNEVSSVSELDIGLPGSLPVLNFDFGDVYCLSKVFKGFTTNWLIFCRKVYFYTDLTLGYQITQNVPFVRCGKFNLIQTNINFSYLIKVIDVYKCCLEQDTGTSFNVNCDKYVDYSRAGLKLLEITTQPCFNTTLQVKSFLIKLKFIFRVLKLSGCFMENSEMRYDLNLSVTLPMFTSCNRVEIKNLNCLFAIEKIIRYEVESLILTCYKRSCTKKLNVNNFAQCFLRKKLLPYEYINLLDPDIVPIKMFYKHVDNTVNVLYIDFLKCVFESFSDFSFINIFIEKFRKCDCLPIELFRFSFKHINLLIKLNYTLNMISVPVI